MITQQWIDEYKNAIKSAKFIFHSLFTEKEEIYSIRFIKDYVNIQFYTVGDYDNDSEYNFSINYLTMPLEQAVTELLEEDRQRQEILAQREKDRIERELKNIRLDINSYTQTIEKRKEEYKKLTGKDFE